MVCQSLQCMMTVTTLNMYKTWRAWTASLVAAVSDTNSRTAVAGYHLFPEDSIIVGHQSHLTVRATAGWSTSTPVSPSLPSWQRQHGLTFHLRRANGAAGTRARAGGNTKGRSLLLIVIPGA